MSAERPPTAPATPRAVPLVTELARLVHSEWTKIVSVRSTAWSLGAMFLLTLGLLVAAGVVVRVNADDAIGLSTFWTIYTSALALGQIPLVVLGAVVVTGEYGSGMIRTTLTAAPRRLRLLTAKLLVFGGLALVVSFALAYGGWWLSMLVTGEYRPDQAFGEDAMVGVAGNALFSAALGLFAFAFALLLRNTAASVSLLLTMLLVLTPLVQVVASAAAMMGSTAFGPVYRFWPINAGSAITQLPGSDLGQQGAPPEVADALALLDPWVGFGVFLGYVAVMLALGAWMFRKRDA